jgi:hypothetical protein
LHGDFVDLQICVLLQRGFAKAGSRFSKRVFEKVDLELETKVLLLDLIDDLMRKESQHSSSQVVTEQPGRRTFSCSRRVIMFAPSANTPPPSLLGSIAKGVEVALLLIAFGTGVATGSNTELSPL